MGGGGAGHTKKTRPDILIGPPTPGQSAAQPTPPHKRGTFRGDLPSGLSDG